MSPAFRIAIFAFALLQAMPAPARTISPSGPDYARAMKHTRALLREQGISEAMVRRLEKSYIRGKKDWVEQAQKVQEPNLFGFLYHGNYFAHDTAKARREISRYLRSHRLSFRAAEKAYQVAPEAIASLLWVETKFGKHTGSFPLPWVFYSLSMVSQPEFCNRMREILPEKLASSLIPEKPDAAVAEQKLRERCQSKAEWAIEELKALDGLGRTGKLAPFKLKGSFAGAFGLPQFLPSSYQKHAVSRFRKRPDLFLASDAILSVGRFLHENGWKNTSQESQATALYSYNRSKDYGAVIRQLAAAVSDSGKAGRI